MENMKKIAVEAYGRFAAEYMSGGLQTEAARDWSVVKAYIDAEADRVAKSDPPVVDRTAVALVNDVDSVLRMMGGSGGRGTTLDNDIWDTVYRFRDKTCTAEINEACDRYSDEETLAAYLDSEAKK